jgi:hypothetical protein
MPKGSKQCDSCGELNGPRSFVCKSCQKPFLFKPAFMKPKRGEALDWHELKRGDRIKVIQGTGPYHLKDDGEKINMGYSGEFNVAYLDGKGIHAYGNKDEGPASHCYIYMGKDERAQSGLYRTSHKIERLRAANKEDVTEKKVSRRLVRKGI